MNNITNQFALETLTEVRERGESEPVHSTFSKYTVHSTQVQCSARCTKQKFFTYGMGMDMDSQFVVSCTHVLYL